ncbi:BamA/TamA family outer membrane protein [Pikeienuella piscinae]|uniref:BamA/TamA family outer membrane protein n=1 Tax=Pikeienuella piscinae TaxID=2748098 RepID=A0A7L5BXS9_9RHOB|nr:BamA/TamA family outer membrane protein [Pikeienuella piscinae]QIE54694.1 BamA/TamA family outer membrane protein [Pikeienuella piscinae]
MIRPGATLRLIPLIGLVLAACSDDPIVAEVEFERPETAVEYDVELNGVENENAAELIGKALELYRQQEKGAQSVAFLRRRAEGDIPTVLKIMRSYGYFEAQTEVKVFAPEDRPAPEVEETAAAAPAAASRPDADEDEAAPPRALVRLNVDANSQYLLAAHRFLLVETGAGAAPVHPDARTLGSPVGEAARAAGILAAEDKAVDRLRAGGRPYATLIGRDAVADPERDELEVETTIATGGPYGFGQVSYEGLETVNAAYLDTYIPFQEGDPADPAKLTEFQRALLDTGLFDAGSASLPDEPPAGELAPVLVTLEEAKPQTVSAGALYSTDAGPAVTGGYQHRNLFGSNETLTLDALLGLEEQSLEARLREPQWRRPGQDLVFGLELRHIDDDAYEEYGGTFTGGLERELSEQLTVGAGGLVELSQITDDDGTEVSKLAGVPMFADYDGANDKLDPSKGVRARLAVTPFAGYVGDDPASFMVVDGTASTYFDLTGERKYILAARGRLGSVIAGDLDTVAANHRLYSGGGGSVRGYKERFIGPLDSDGDPTGGLSVAELGVELRARVAEAIGVVGFVDSGTVSTELFPAFDEGVQVAVGGGVRYFSPVGPLRLDVGFPVNPRKEDDFFQFYISIGQAF